MHGLESRDLWKTPACCTGLELTAPGPDRRMGAFDEKGAQDQVSSPYPSDAALAGTLVVPGTDPRPGGAVPGGCEDRHGGDQFDEDRHGGFAADAGQGRYLKTPAWGRILVPDCP